MSLVSQLTDYIHAAFPGLWVQTVEPDEAERELVEHARREQWTLAVWDVARGLRFPANSNAAVPDVNDPVAVLKTLPTLAPPVEASDDEAPQAHTTLLVLPNFHRYLNSTETIQTLFEQLVARKQKRTFVGLLSTNALSQLQFREGRGPHREVRVVGVLPISRDHPPRQRPDLGPIVVQGRDDVRVEIDRRLLQGHLNSDPHNTRLITIPGSDRIEPLNVSAAAAVLLWECMRPRQPTRSPRSAAPDLPAPRSEI